MAQPNQQLPEYKDPKDKTDKVLVEVYKWKETRLKGSITIHFDGSGRIARYTVTLEGT